MIGFLDSDVVEKWGSYINTQLSKQVSTVLLLPFCTCANLETGVWLCRTEKCYSVLPSLSAQSPNRMELWHSYHIFYKNATTLSDLETEHLDYVLSQVCFSSSRRYTELLEAYCAL